jgi:hypothetical protein
MLNLFILVILQQFDEYYLPQDNILERFRDDLEKFKKTWTDFTRDYKCLKIKDNMLVKFFDSMEPELGMNGLTHNDIVCEIVKMDLERYLLPNEYLVMRKVIYTSMSSSSNL